MGIWRKAEETHHLIPISEGGGNDESNLIALCAACHDKAHNKIRIRDKKEEQGK